MVSSVTIRKLVAGLGTALIIALSLLTFGTLPLIGLSKVIASAFGAAMLYTSVALASAIHRSYPAKHDKPEDVKELFVEGPYKLCRHPFYLLTMMAQISIALSLASLMGLLTAITLIPLWLFLIRVEEKELIEYWGEKYLSYMARTPMLIPNLKKVLRNS